MAEASALVRRSPLSHRLPIAGEDVRIVEQPFLGKFILRGDPQAVEARLKDVFGIGLPFEPLTSSSFRDTAFLWMGPDEWMFVTAGAEAEERSGRARRALEGLHHQLVDVSDFYTVVEVAGPRARELLMKLTSLDLHPRSFGAGRVTGSVFGRVNAMVWQTADEGEGSGPVFRLFIRWSMADYLWCLIANAGREWGVPKQVPVKGERLTIGA